MVRDPFATEGAPDVEDVLDALHDEDCRRIIRSLEEPMTANDVSDACEIPLSTTYRKLDTMTEATLLEELTEIRPDGRHTTRYRIAFEEVLLFLEDDRSLELAVSRPARTADERLGYLWSEVRKGV
jgi:DNA-binding transcriptional ArsR family regulator